MSISHELSSDLAEALLLEDKGKDAADRVALVEIVAKVHSTLRQLTAEERKERRRFSDSAAAAS